MTAGENVEAAQAAGERPRTGAAAAAFAAVAEAGLIFLPLRELVRETAVHGAGGPLGTYPAFLLLFVVATAIATSRRESPLFAPAVLAVTLVVGLVESLAFGAHSVPSAILGVGLSLLVAVRVVTLALRDWRDPVQSSFGWGAGILLIETVIGWRAGPWAPAWLVALAFFVGSLASRAASLRLAEGTQVVGRTSAPWLGLGAALAGVVAAVGVAASVVGGEGGLLERLGRVIPLALYGAIYAGVFLLSVVLRPVGWVLHQLGFHSVDVSRITGHLRRTLRGFGHALRPDGQPGFLQRALGLALLAGFGALLAWVIVQQRRRWVERERRLAEVVDPVPVPEPPARSRRRERVRRRRELPEDTVRRWYAEVLLEMERLGTSKPPWATPAEFLSVAGAAFPAAAGSLTALTRAYEDVRYGNRDIPPDRVDRLEAHRGAVLQALRGPATEPRSG